MAHKVFWVLHKKDIRYHRIMCKVLPHSRGHDNLMVMSPDQMEWISSVLTEETRFEILKNMWINDYAVGNYNNYTNIRTGIHHKSRQGVVGQCVYLKMWIKCDVRYVEHRITRNQMRQYDIIIPSVYLAELIMEQ